ncbi:MAG: DNA internalization-related competence protein ComEC/Rec2 [Candidatus Zipacnadales bacterium]
MCLLFLIGIWLDSFQLVPFIGWAVVSLLGGLAGAVGGGATLRGGALGVAAIAAGGLLHAVETSPWPDDISRVAGRREPVTIEGFVIAELPCHYASRRLVVQVTRVCGGTGSFTASGRVLVRTRDGTQGEAGLPVRCRGMLRRLRPPTNPGSFDAATALTRKGLSAIMEEAQLELWHTGALPFYSRILREAANCRRAITKHLSEAMPGPNAQEYVHFLSGIVLGVEVTPLSAAIVETFRRTGAIHVLVVSGAQITLLAGAIMVLTGLRRLLVVHWLARMLRHRSPVPSRFVRRLRWWQALLMAGPLILFALLVGLGPSVARAISLFTLYILATLFDEEYDPYVALGVTAAVICLFDANTLFTIAAQLSFAATLGVIVGVRTVRFQFTDSPQPWRSVISLVGAMVGAWLMVTPLLAYHFRAFPLLGSLSNVVAIPISGVLIFVTVLAMGLSWIYQALASVVLWPARWMVDIMLAANTFFADLPGAYVSANGFSWGTCTAWYAGLALVACGYRARQLHRGTITPKGLLFATVGLALMLSIWFAVSGGSPNRLIITFLDVGHGQCCLVQAPQRTIMVDAGSGYSLQAGERCAQDVILPFLLSQRIGHLDAVIITHPDADHCNALPAILAANIKVDLILESFPATDSTVYDVLRAAAQERGVPFQTTYAGGQLNLGSGITAEVLWPTGAQSDATFEPNDRSVVLRIEHGAVSVLLTGDIGVTVEHELIQRGAELRATVLQVPHHGGLHSSSPEFITRVAPQQAVVSCRAADSDHPHPVIQERLQKIDVRLWRTDREGAITVESDGQTVRVRGHAARRVSQNGARCLEQTWASASSRASGLSLPSAAASGGRLWLKVSTMRPATLLRTCVFSSDRRCRNRSIVARWLGESVATAGRTRETRSLAAVNEGCGGSIASGSGVPRNFTTTVPAATSPRRLLCLCTNAISPPIK